jgi:hypothetical protein
MLAQHCRLYEVTDLARGTMLAFLTHLPHGIFRSHLCLSLQRAVGVEFLIGCARLAHLRHSAQALLERAVAEASGFVAAVVIGASDVEEDWAANVGVRIRDLGLELTRA